MVNIEFKILDFQSNEYKESVDLRRKILRKPLGIDFSEEQLSKEFIDKHLGLFLKNELIACLILSAEENAKIKMRQVAVDDQFQGKGFGKKLLEYAESYATSNGFNYMHCNARETAVAFYLSAGYQVKGDAFLEINIPHYYMYKNI